MSIEIREATLAEMPAITEVYNHAIAHTTSVFSEELVTVEMRIAWWHDKLAQGFPVFVAMYQETFAGFASYGHFRPWPGYRFTVENAIYIHPLMQGKGIATLLLQTLVNHAAAAGFKQMIAGIGADNEASLKLHEKLGFVKTGCLPEIAFKFDKWLDLQFMQRRL